MDNKLDFFEAELGKIQKDIQLKGLNPENEGRLKKLVSDIKLVIAMGPSESIVRERVDPNTPDALDFDYFRSILDGASEIFNDDSWGKANVNLEQRDFGGANVPALVVRWSDYYQFYLDKCINQEETDKKLNAYSSTLATLLTLKWHAWIVEII